MEVRELRAPPSASKTFHGRDVFAKAAARIAVGEFSELGKKKSGMQKLEFKLDLRNREGEIVRIDSFGNILTNLPPVAGKKSYVVQTERQKMYVNFCETYARAPPDAFFVVRGSSGALEVSLKNGNAAEKLGVQSGERIVIK
jgi:hypothetical protein